MFCLCCVRFCLYFVVVVVLRVKIIVRFGGMFLSVCFSLTFFLSLNFVSVDRILFMLFAFCFRIRFLGICVAGRRVGLIVRVFGWFFICVFVFNVCFGKFVFSLIRS